MPVIYSEELEKYSEDSIQSHICANSLIKSSEWAHEREWRLMKYDEEQAGKNEIVMVYWQKYYKSYFTKMLSRSSIKCLWMHRLL